jgi:hypothetical protein
MVGWQGGSNALIVSLSIVSLSIIHHAKRHLEP